MSSKPSVKAVRSIGLTTLTLVEETGKTCHFTAPGVPFRQLYSVSLTPTPKRRHQKQSVRNITKSLVLQAVGRFTWPTLVTTAASLTLRPGFHPPDCEKHIPLNFHKSVELEKSPQCHQVKEPALGLSLEGGVSPSLSLLSRTFPNTGQIVRPAQGG